MTVDELRLYSIAEAAELLCVSELWYKRKLAARELPGRRAGRKWAVSFDDIQAAKEIMASPAVAVKPDPSGLTRTSRRRIARRGGAS